MTPVRQTIHGIGGNCFAACLATIFDLPLSEVPHLFGQSGGKSIWTQQQWDAVRLFGWERGREATWLDPDNEEDSPLIRILNESQVPTIATGPSMAGDFGHCVVMQNGKIVHDPAGCCGLKGPPWLYILFQ